MNLKELEERIKNNAQQAEKLPRQKHITVNLTHGQKDIDVCVLSNIQIGLTGAHMHTAKEDRPVRINKLKAHIAELAKNPNAKVFLGGDLFYFPGGTMETREMYSPSYEEQVDIMAELLEPIKDKIIAAYAGTDEVKIFEKDHLDLTQKLMERLDLADRYCGQMAEVDFIFNNEYTNYTPKTVNMLFDHGFLVANTLGTVAKKTEDLQKKINGKDFYFTSHYNKLMIEKRATLIADNGTRMIKVPSYFISVGGYRDFANRLASNRNTSPSNTNNGMFRIFVAPNPDRNNVRGHDYLGEPQFKICQEFINFGRNGSKHFDFDLIEEVARTKEENILIRDALLQKIKEKVEMINHNNALISLSHSYKEEQTPEQVELAKRVRQEARTKEKPYIINENLGKGE